MKYQEYEVTIKLGGITHTMMVTPKVSRLRWLLMTAENRRSHLYEVAKNMVLELMELDLKELWDIDRGCN